MFEIEGTKNPDEVVIKTATKTIKFNMADSTVDAGLAVGILTGPGEFEIGEATVRGIGVSNNQATIYDVEIGGTDQTFNVLVGRELKRDFNQTPQEVITFPLLPGLDGVEKMSKSLGNYIGINDSADEMFEKCMKVPDTLLQTYFTLTTDYDLDSATKLIAEDVVNAHVVYGKEIVKMYHSESEAESAYERYKKVAKGGIPTDLEEVNPNKENPTLIDCLMAGKLCNSTSEARRLIAQNGVKVNGEVETNINRVVESGAVIQKGKNKFVKISY